MVGFDSVVRILLGVVEGTCDELVKDPRGGRRPVVVTSTGTAPVASARVKNTRAAVRSRLADSHTSMVCPYWSTPPLQLRPPAVDLDVGLVDQPAITRYVTARRRGFDELRCEPLHPPIDRDVIDVHCPLGKQLLDVTSRTGRTAGTTAPPPSAVELARRSRKIGR